MHVQNSKQLVFNTDLRSERTLRLGLEKGEVILFQHKNRRMYKSKYEAIKNASFYLLTSLKHKEIQGFDI